MFIVGGGPLKDELLQLRERLQLTDCVEFLGIRRDVAKLMSAADVFVLSSALEGFGLVVAEAMAAERVVIATDSGGVAEVLGGNGFLVAARDSEALAESMQAAAALSDESASEYGRKSRQYIIEKFGLNSVVDRWEAIYTGVQQ